MPGRLVLNSPRADELLRRYLAIGYHVTRGMVPLMEAALQRARELVPGDPVAAGLAAYLERHIPEEMHGDEPGGALLDDLGALGVDPVTLSTQLPPPKIAALVGAQYFWILHHHPVAVLGYLQLETFHPHRPTLERLIEKTGLPRDGFRQLLLHAELEVEHATELRRVLDSLPLERRHEELIGLSALQTVALLTEALLDAVQGDVYSERARGPAEPTLYR
jgi:Iron-containing redox enzyme